MMDVKNLSGSHYALSVTNEVRDICKPLFSCFDLSYFYSTRVFPDGSDFVLSTNPDIVEYVYTHGYRRPGSDDHGQNVLPDGWFLRGDINYAPVFKRQYEELRYKFHLQHVLAGAKHHDKYSDLYLMGSQDHNDQIISRYLNNINMFDKFITYFQTRASRLYEAASNKKNRLNFPPLDKADVGFLQGMNYDSRRKAFIHQVVNAMNVVTKEGKEVHLSNREKECLMGLSKGKSIKETAGILGISPRTVSVHVKNIKDKLNCYSKSAIIELFRSQIFYDDDL